MNKNKIIKTLSEQEILDSLYKGHKLKDCMCSDPEKLKQLTDACNYFDIDVPFISSIDNVDTFISDRINSWNIPEQYMNIDIEKFLYSCCKTPEETNRIDKELKLFRETNAMTVLHMMVYIVHVAKKNNIVLGVGRGSSVASLSLYFLGVHKVHPLKHNIPLDDFFHE